MTFQNAANFVVQLTAASLVRVVLGGRPERPAADGPALSGVQALDRNGAAREDHRRPDAGPRGSSLSELSFSFFVKKTIDFDAAIAAALSLSLFFHSSFSSFSRESFVRCARKKTEGEKEKNS